jgi:hypothetical protein
VQQSDTAPANEKTQTSSTPLSPVVNQQDLPPPMPIVRVNLQYKPIDEISKSAWYVKHIPNVLVDHCTFNFQDEDYELSVKDREYLKLESQLSMISEKDFERIIDCLEKVAFMYKDT